MDHGRIIEAEAARHAVAELPSVLDVVHTGNRVFAADQEGAVVARITIPGRRIGRRRLTEGEAGELQEHVLNRDIAAADARKRGIVQATKRAGGRGDNRRVASLEVLELEVALSKGTNDAVLGGGAGINRQRHTRAAVDVIGPAITLAGVAAIGRSIVNVTAVERGVDAQITTDLDAGIGARDIEESGTIQGADPHVLDRFGLDGKISCLW